ncbi:MAG: sensor histidine kinase [Clostridia bacterium]
MDTKLSKTKTSIGFRITAVQVLVIIMVSVSVLVTTAFTITDYISQRNFYELETTSKGVAQIVLNTSFKNERLIQELISQSQSNIEIILLNNELNIVLSSFQGFNETVVLPDELKAAIVSQSKEQGSWNEYYYFVERFSGADRSGYVLALSPRDDQIIIRDSFLWSVVRVIVIAVLIGVLFGSYLTSKLIEPLQNLEKRLKEISIGDFSGRLKVEEDDELGDIAKAFNNMSQQLERYQKAQSRFIQNASHELKSPLMNIQGYAEGLQAGVFNESEKDEALDIVVSETQRLKSVVEELLFISKIDDESITVEFNKVDIGDIINEALRTVYTRIQQKELDLQVIIEEDLLVKGDYSSLMRAFANILDNAVRYADERILIQGLSADKQVVVRIVDDGPGFEEKEIPKVFERFFKGKEGSTGLGMAIVKDIINIHQGEVVIYNHTTGGAVVEIKLPI